MVPYFTTEMAGERTRELHRAAEEARRARLAAGSAARIGPARRALGRGLIRLGTALAPRHTPDVTAPERSRAL